MDRVETILELDIMQKKYAHIRKNELEWEAIENAIDALESQEPEIVRCKNCKEWKMKENYCEYLGITICADGFCSYGEKRG